MLLYKQLLNTAKCGAWESKVCICRRARGSSGLHAADVRAAHVHASNGCSVLFKAIESLDFIRFH